MKARDDLDILANHIGYASASTKSAVLKGRKGAEAPGGQAPPGGEQPSPGFDIVEARSGSTVFRGKARFAGAVARWKDWVFWSLDFTALERPGTYLIQLETEPGRSPLRSRPFEISQDPLLNRTAPAVLDYFRSRRCSGIWDRADRGAGFVGSRSDRVDVHGGWYDASGDISKYLSHLSYANYMNPQQTPLAVWSFLRARELLGRKEASPPEAAGLQGLRVGLLEEALYGADFLVRMQDPAGYFYVGVFDRWSKDPDQRRICSFRGQAGHRSEDYQAGYRQGGGLAIAALAGVSTLGAAGEFGPEQYLHAAVRAFHHLEKHNTAYLDDGQENIIDDYCALLAASELYEAARMCGAGGGEPFLGAARRRTRQLTARLSEDERYKGWWRADRAGQRPYYHAVEAGLPVVSLLRYRQVEPEGRRREQALGTVAASLCFELAVTGEVVNPFGYARQYVRSRTGPKRSSFFMPHDNESGYWWQGEDARLASLAAAARLSVPELAHEPELARRLEEYAGHQLDWILGLNPFDACMLHGFGRNNPEYEPDYPNAFGGICNGITAGFEEEQDIDFLPLPYAAQGEHRWRWSEQWIPHAAWYLLAVCSAPPLPASGRR